jgi:hypothetical protein
VEFGDDGSIAESSVDAGFSSERPATSMTAAVSGSRTAILVNGQLALYEGSVHLRTIDVGGFGEPSSVVASGSHFVVTWVAAGNIFMCQTFDLDGNASGPAGGTGVGFPATYGSAAGGEGGALLAWGEGAWLRIATVDPQTGVVSKRASVLAEYAAPRTVWTGSQYVVAWPDPGRQGVLGVRVTSHGELLDTEPVTLFDGATSYFTLGVRDGAVMMLYEQTDFCGRYFCVTDVYVVPLAPSASGTRLISAAARVQHSPAVASNGTGFASVWIEDSTVQATFTAPGEREPTLPLTIESEGVLPSVAVASDSSGYLSTWLAHRGSRYFVEGARLSADEQAPSPARSFSIDAGAGGNFGLVAGGSPDGYLVAWQQDGAFRAMRVRPNGEPIDVVPVSLTDGSPASPPSAIAFDGRDFVVSAISFGGSADATSGVFSLRVSPGGTASFDRTWATAEMGAIPAATLACGGGTCLVAWVQRADPYGLTWQLLGRRFRTGGDPIDGVPFTIDFSSWQQVEPRIAWDGFRFVTSWSGADDAGGTAIVEARSIPATGAVDQSGAFSPDRLAETRPSAPIACSLEGRCLLLNAVPVDDSPLGRTSRVLKRFFGVARVRGARR